MTVDELKKRLSLPVIGAPMFLASGVDLVVAQCCAGVIGTFPALNARPAARSSVIVDSKGRLQGPIPREEMIHRGDLIRRLGEGGADYVDVNDIKLIEDCVHRHCDRSVLHAVRCALIPVARADDAKDAA